MWVKRNKMLELFGWESFAVRRELHSENGRVHSLHVEYALHHRCINLSIIYKRAYSCCCCIGNRTMCYLWSLLSNNAVRDDRNNFIRNQKFYYYQFKQLIILVCNLYYMLYIHARILCTQRQTECKHIGFHVSGLYSAMNMCFAFIHPKAEKVQAKEVRCLFYICFSEPKVMTLFHKSFGKDSMAKIEAIRFYSNY